MYFTSVDVKYSSLKSSYLLYSVSGSDQGPCVMPKLYTNGSSSSSSNGGGGKGGGEEKGKFSNEDCGRKGV